MNKKNLIFIAPFPPPHHGQAIASINLFNIIFSENNFYTKVFDTSGSWRGLKKLLVHLKAFFEILFSPSVVYISLSSNAGIWANLFLMIACRLSADKVFLHYHAYSHLNKKSKVISYISAIGGEKVVHLVLGEKMRDDLGSIVKCKDNILILNNAGLIDYRLRDVELNLKDSNIVTLGHLSNLSESKGIGRVIDAAFFLVKSGIEVELIIAGPCVDDFAKASLERARNELGGKITYIGSVNDDEKVKFFNSIDIFLFPSLYKNEAEPLVLLEAMASGTPCIAYDIGCIKGDVMPNGGVVVDGEYNFPEIVLNFSRDFFVKNMREEISKNTRLQFFDVLENHKIQMSNFLSQLKS